jgi:DNA topoisomerase-1
MVTLTCVQRTLWKSLWRGQTFSQNRLRSVLGGSTPLQIRASGSAVMLVESPTKAKKIQEYLGPDFQVLASYGHIRDLPAKSGSVRPEEDFAFSWHLDEAASSRLNGIIFALRSARKLILATDPDREGEAISWHILDELKSRGALHPDLQAERITFTEVTRSAIYDALKSPRELSVPLVDAYMARRALDYLFGFTLSPLLWRKLPGARSAGRVQSVALRLVCEREAAIEAFVPLKYWTVHACVCLSPGSQPLEATLTSVDGSSPPKPGFLCEKEAEEVVRRIELAEFAVSSVRQREVSRHAPPPFVTSTLQQECNRRLNFGASRTMQLAQKLYEAGIITYMRTDGTNIAPQALTALRAVLNDQYGAEYVPNTPNYYASKVKNAQEAHEAIRPTDPTLSPGDLVAKGFEPAAVSLYEIIRARALASQTVDAKVQQIGVDFASKDTTLVLRCTASKVVFPGYFALYDSKYFEHKSSQGIDRYDDETTAKQDFEGNSEDASASLTSESYSVEALSLLRQGDPVQMHSPASKLSQTKPPGRFTEGSLIKAMEGAGVGRPSTYAPTIRLLQSRRYISKQGRSLQAEPLGRILSAFLCKYFPKYVDYGFTSNLEDGLDEVSKGALAWKELLGEFWGPFQKRVDELGNLSGTEVIEMLNEELRLFLFGGNCTFTDDEVPSAVGVPTCPSCGSQLSLKMSHRGGPFIGCSSYPECKYAIGIRDMASDEPEEDGDGSSAGMKNPLKGLLSVKGLETAEKYGMRGAAHFLGLHTSGKEVFLRRGPYGTYVQLGRDSDPSMRRAPLPKDHERSISLDYATALLALPRTVGQHPVTGALIEVRNGKYGPFVLHGNTKRSLPKTLDPLTITVEEALQLLQLSSQKSSRRKKGCQDKEKEKEKEKEEEPEIRTKTGDGSWDGEEKERITGAARGQIQTVCPNVTGKFFIFTMISSV